jgi:hypothetical protein
VIHFHTAHWPEYAPYAVFIIGTNIQDTRAALTGLKDLCVELDGKPVGLKIGLTYKCALIFATAYNQFPVFCAGILYGIPKIPVVETGLVEGRFVIDRVKRDLDGGIE